MSKKENAAKMGEKFGLDGFKAFVKSDFLVEKKNAITMERIIVDNRFFTQYSQELLRETVNTEIIASKLVDDDVYTSTINALTNRSSERVVTTLFPLPVVNLDVPSVETRKIMDACYAITNDLQTAMIMSEFVRHCLAPYGVLNPVDRKSVV